MKNNPLLCNDALPRFSEVRAEEIVPALETVLAENREQIKQLLNNTQDYTWENFMRPFEAIDDRLSFLWSVVTHLHAVSDSEPLREAYHQCLPMLSDYTSEMSHNKKIYEAIKSFTEKSKNDELNQAQRQVIKNDLRDFRLAGITLGPDEKKQFSDFHKRLSELHTQFEENVLDATQRWSCLVVDEERLSCLPEVAKTAALKAADERQMVGWLLTLDHPCFLAVMTYVDERPLREEMYHAYVTRASDEGAAAGQYDNTPVIQSILKVRHSLSKLLGFNDFAEYSLETKMAKSKQEVLGFLQKLINSVFPIAKKEFEELSKFAASEHNVSQLEPWDIAYFSEKLKQQQFRFTNEDLRPYFPIDEVIKGIFLLFKKLYGLTVSETPGVDVWDKSVRFFSIYDDQKELRGQFYLDIFTRLHKRGGAWMDECRSRRVLDSGEVQNPVAFIVCNFSPQTSGKQLLLTHEEVLTLLHEFGHALQHLLTTVDYPGVAGISGVLWDAIEFPSQFMECWGWNEDALTSMSAHYRTGEKLPKELFAKLLSARNFHAGLRMLGQLQYSLFDFRLHTEFDDEITGQVQQIIDEVRNEISVTPVKSYDRFQHSFTHIFAGGYAAGYYSYKWAEVLSSDAFSKFEEDGLFNSTTGRLFLETILESGGSQDPLVLFKKFRGRGPEINAFLKYHGVTKD